MKTFLLILIALTISNMLNAQSLKIYSNGVVKDSVDMCTTDSIAVIPSWKCGTNGIRYSNQIYHTVQIGTQCWLKENLNVGTRINGSQDQSDNGVIEKYCYSDNQSNCTIYGGLYQWAEAVQYQNGATNTKLANPPLTGNVQGICPTGWHIPTNAEYTTLKTSVSSNGNALKSIGQGTGAGAGTNTSGFSALLSGYRDNSEPFYGLGNFGAFWNSSEYGATDGYSMTLDISDSSIIQGPASKVFGYSVRCVKDN